MPDILTAFYSDPRANSAFLSLLAALSWSFFDLMSGINVGTDINLTTLVMGVGLLSAAAFGFVFERREAVAALKRRADFAAAVARGLVGIVDTVVYIYAQKLVPVGDVVLFCHLSAIYIPFADSVWRRRLPSKPQWVSICLCFVGVVLVTQPSFIFGHAHSGQGPSQFPGHLCAFITGVSWTIDTMLVGVFEDVPVCNWIGSLGAALVACGVVGAAIKGGVTPASSPRIAASLAALTLLNLAAQTTNTLGIKVHTATLSALVSVSQLPLSYALGWIWLDQDMNSIKILGVVSVIVGVTVAIVGTRPEVEK